MYMHNSMLSFSPCRKSAGTKQPPTVASGETSQMSNAKTTIITT